MASSTVRVVSSFVMAPITSFDAAVMQIANLVPRDAFPGVQLQWKNPSDLFSILLLVGGDIIQRAIAQLSSPYYFTPVAFSFGWVSYAVSAITSAIGDGKLMPETDCSSIVVNTKSRNTRNNNSWILGRILRDWPEEGLKDKNGDYALVVTLCEQISTKAGKPVFDLVWYAGVITILAQIVISTIPGVRDGHWTVLVITVGGTLVCLAQSALPQWSAEKFKCRWVAENKIQTIALTRGNGHHHVLVITSKEGGLNLEDLAAGRISKHKTTLPFTLALSVLWFVILLTAIAVQEDTWFLLLVGSIGMVQNIFAAGYKRKPDAFGLHLSEPKTIIKPDIGGDHPSNKVFKVIEKAEIEQPGLGLALLGVFFDGELHAKEKKWKEKAVAKVSNDKKVDLESEEKTLAAVSIEPNKTA